MRDFDVKLDTTTTSSINAHFGIELATLIKKLTVDSSVNRIDFHVMRIDIFFLLCL